MNEYRLLAQDIRTSGAWVDRDLQSYSMHRTVKEKDSALERIKHLRLLLDEAEKFVLEDEKQLTEWEVDGRKAESESAG